MLELDQLFIEVVKLSNYFIIEGPTIQFMGEE